MESNKRPYRALLAGILLPGLGHLYAGNKRRALTAFLLVTIPFVIGAMLADYRVFAFTGNPFAGSDSVLKVLLAKLPIQCWPEIGNMAESTLLWNLQPPLDADWSRMLRLPVEHENLGLMLTGLSSALNMLLAADACWLVARDRLSAERDRPIGGHLGRNLLWAWMVPGMGHWLLGKKQTALLVGGSLLSLWILGLYFSDFRGIDRSQLYWWWAAQAGMGGPTLVSSLAFGTLEIARDIPQMDLGITLLSVAGLLNLAVLTDVYSQSETQALQAAGLIGASSGVGARP